MGNIVDSYCVVFEIKINYNKVLGEYLEFNLDLEVVYFDNIFDIVLMVICFYVVFILVVLFCVVWGEFVVEIMFF